jgi:hypothetical protein
MEERGVNIDHATLGIINLLGTVNIGVALSELSYFQFTGDIMLHTLSIGSGVTI